MTYAFGYGHGAGGGGGEITAPPVAFDSLYWIGGAAFKAKGYAPGAPVPAWPDELGALGDLAPYAGDVAPTLGADGWVACSFDGAVASRLVLDLAAPIPTPWSAVIVAVIPAGTTWASSPFYLSNADWQPGISLNGPIDNPGTSWTAPVSPVTLALPAGVAVAGDVAHLALLSIDSIDLPIFAVDGFEDSDAVPGSRAIDAIEIGGPTMGVAYSCASRHALVGITRRALAPEERAALLAWAGAYGVAPAGDAAAIRPTKDN